MKATPALMTTPQLQAYLGGVCAETLLRWRTHRGLPFHRISATCIRYFKSEVDAWLLADAAKGATLGAPTSAEPVRCEEDRLP